MTNFILREQFFLENNKKDFKKNVQALTQKKEGALLIG